MKRIALVAILALLMTATPAVTAEFPEHEKRAGAGLDGAYAVYEDDERYCGVALELPHHRGGIVYCQL